MVTTIKQKEIISLLGKTEELFNEYVKTIELRRHCIQVREIMRALAQKLIKDNIISSGTNPREREEEWATTGLLHDLDFEEYPDLQEHCKITAQRLKPLGYHDNMIHAILAHNSSGTKVQPEHVLDYALRASDNISGLVYAYALMRGGFTGMKVKGLKKKFKDKTFAAKIERDKILEIEKINLTLEEFFEIVIKAMQNISTQLGFEKD